MSLISADKYNNYLLEMQNLNETDLQEIKADLLSTQSKILDQLNVRRKSG